MAFNWNRFAYTNFHELNLDWFNEHFKEIFEEWEELYNTLTQWKIDTDADLAQWKEDTLSDMETWENNLLDALDEWKAATGEDIGEWEAGVISDLNDWKDDFNTAFDSMYNRVDAIVSDTEDMVENLAEPFSTSKNYVIGDYVIYNGVLYKFIQNHSAGAWAAEDALQIAAMDVMKTCDKATDFQKITYTNILKAIVTPVDGQTGDLTPVTSAAFNSVVVPCSEGDLFTITGTGGQSVKLWCFVDANNVGLETAKQNVTASNLIIVAPKNAAKLILNNSNINESYKGITVDAKDSFLKNNVLYGEGFEQLRFSTSSYCINCATDLSSLNPTQTSNVYRFCLVEANPGDLFTITCTGGASPRAYAFIDNSLHILENAGSSATFIDKVIKAPANTAYLIINDSSGTGYVFKGITDKALNKLEKNIYKNTISDSNGLSAFVAYMNKIATEMGMTDSTFVNPSGLTTSNTIRILDALKLGLEFYSRNRLLEYCSMTDFNVKINGTPTAITNTYLTAINTSLTDGIPLCGKGGSLNNIYRSQITYAIVDDLPCILAAFVTDTTDYDYLYTYINDLAIMMHDYITNGSYTVPTHGVNPDLTGAVSRGGSYGAIVIPPINSAAFYGNVAPSDIEDFKYAIVAGKTNDCIPCSIVKMLASIAVENLISDLNDTVIVETSDLVGGSGTELHRNEQFTFEDGLRMALGESNNSAITACARMAGKKL